MPVVLVQLQPQSFPKQIDKTVWCCPRPVPFFMSECKLLKMLASEPADCIVRQEIQLEHAQNLKPIFIVKLKYDVPNTGPVSAHMQPL